MQEPSLLDLARTLWPSMVPSTAPGSKSVRIFTDRLGCRPWDLAKKRSNKSTAVGNSPCVNMIGATVGAGVGPLQGQFGLVLDSLLSIDLVTAKGDLVTASQTENPGLFWAVRGAGASFGVVVSATYKTHDTVNNGQVIIADFILSSTANVSTWELLKSWDSDDVFPSEMGLSIVGGFNSTTRIVSRASIPIPVSEPSNGPHSREEHTS